MSTNEIDIDAGAARVFDAIADARTYPAWLVGAQRIRRVDRDWPAVGSQFHHLVGAGPFLIGDRTRITEIERPTMLRLDAGVGPLGGADVRFTVESLEGGRTRVTVEEAPARGPLKLMWRLAGKPLMQLGLFGRNQLSLSQLRDFVAAGRPADPDEAAAHGQDRSIGQG